jgi:hypothetical protein
VQGELSSGGDGVDSDASRQDTGLRTSVLDSRTPDASKELLRECSGICGIDIGQQYREFIAGEAGQQVAPSAHLPLKESCELAQALVTTEVAVCAIVGLETL